MKKLIVLLLVTAFACSPMTQTQAQAAPAGKALHAKHLKKVNHRLKRQVKHLRHKLHSKGHAHKQAA